MSLASTMSTALTGLNASDTQIDVIGNNLANANTVGFKASDVLFANQFLQTQSVGSAPTANSGGNNPQQTGLGVEVAEITPNFSQGTISTANSPTDMAIQGDGFFIVQGENGAQNYTRNGTFTTNSENQLVTGTGNRVMGYGTNNDFQIDTSQLQPLSIPLGTATVAKATTSATLQGSLTPDGKVANTASIIQTGVAHRREHCPTRQQPHGGRGPQCGRARGRQPQRHVPILHHLLQFQHQRGNAAAIGGDHLAIVDQQPGHAHEFSNSRCGHLDVGTNLSQHE